MKKFDCLLRVLFPGRYAGAGILGLFLAVSTVSSCDDSEEDGRLAKLETPRLKVENVTAHSAVVSWAEIPGAGSYRCVVTGPEETPVFDRTLTGATPPPSKI